MRTETDRCFQNKSMTSTTTTMTTNKLKSNKYIFNRPIELEFKKAILCLHFDGLCENNMNEKKSIAPFSRQIHSLICGRAAGVWLNEKKNKQQRRQRRRPRVITVNKKLLALWFGSCFTHLLVAAELRNDSQYKEYRNRHIYIYI